ncbi:hypothetical protein DSECCO2_425870 [anaerobic digester metagenome]
MFLRTCTSLIETTARLKAISPALTKITSACWAAGSRTCLMTSFGDAPLITAPRRTAAPPTGGAPSPMATTLSNPSSAASTAIRASVESPAG